MLSQQLEITSAVARSLLAQDDADTDMLNKQWADDAVLIYAEGQGMGDEVAGRDKVLSYLMKAAEKRGPRLHFMGAPVIDRQSGTAARVTYLVLCPKKGGGADQPSIQCHCDHVKHGPAGWIITRREITVLDNG